MKSLPSLPGGNADHLVTLVEILEWIDQAQVPEFDVFADWMSNRYKTRRTTVNVYAQVVIRLNVVQKTNDNRLTISKFGRQILTSDLETRSKLLGQVLMTEYVAVRDVLAVYAHASVPIHIDTVIQKLGARYSEWTSPKQFDERIHWLLSLQCLQRVNGRNYEITELGRELSAQYPPDEPSILDEVLSDAAASAIDQVSESESSTLQRNESHSLSSLIDEIIRTSTGNAYKEFEQALVKAFKYLGFAVVYLGESGETDLLLVASVGPTSYRVIVDAKSRQNGKLESVEVYTLQDHLRRHKADYAVVIAKSFASGKVARHAEDNGIVLLSVEVLIKWLNQFARIPLNLADYRNMFTKPGILDDLPYEMVNIAQQRQKWPQLIVDLMELIQETYQHGINQALPGDHLFTMLAMRLHGVHHTTQEVQDAISLLLHPAFNCAIGGIDSGISLAMNRRTLAHTLRTFADLVDIDEINQ